MSGMALVLAGHGSHISPETAGIVWDQVDTLRAMGVADEVTAAFWKEMPSFHTVFNSLEATDITVVPLFTAQGYFTQTVIPAEMGLTGAITKRDRRTIRYTRTLGEHPSFFAVVHERIRGALRVLKSPPEETAVAIIGHSTRRNLDSRKAAEAQADYVRTLGVASQVEAVFLDDSPAIADIYSLTNAFNLIIVPYFLAAGSHTTIDIPRELGLVTRKPPEQVNGRRVYYARPVGLTGNLTTVILELAHDAEAHLKPHRQGSPWDCFPALGRSRYWQMMQAISPVKLGMSSIRLGQLDLTMSEVICRSDDSPLETITDPGELRRRVRENPFRPLATSNDLPRGWRVPVEDDLNRLHAIVETVYPGLVGDIMGHLFGVSDLKKTIARQTGQYRALEGLSSAQVKQVVHRVCGGCVRRPNWHYKQSITGSKPSKLGCPEPCNFWLSAAMKELGTQDEES